MTHLELIELLIDAGFNEGWSLENETLTLWLHDQEPPAPLTRPKATDETPSAD
jgi:hypothetical protein